jgi:hypothetical protein
MRLGLQPGNVYKIIHSGRPHMTYTVKYLESLGPGRIKVEFLKIEGPGMGGHGRMNYPIDKQFGQMLTQMIQSAELVQKKGGKRKTRKTRKSHRKGSRSAHRKGSRKAHRKGSRSAYRKSRRSCCK